MKLSPYMLALALPVLWSCADTQDVTSVKSSANPLYDVSQNLPLTYDVENTAAGFPAPTFASFDQLPVEKILPDPFRSFSGDVDLTFGGWERRRAELKASLENYEIGPKPDGSDVTVAPSFANDTLTVVVTRKSNGRSLTLKSPIHLPAGAGPFPAVIGMTSRFCVFFGGCTGAGSVPISVFTSRSIVTIPYMHDQVSIYYSSTPHDTDPFYQLYPEYHIPHGNTGQYSAWVWGFSRLVDGIQALAREGTLPIDMKHLAATGCSYAGKMALMAGAMDERVALTIAQESGGGGIPSWRLSQAIEPNGTVEKIDNTDYTWFRQDMHEFAGDNVYKLPHDHHELMAMVAPRALLVTGNTSFTWLSNRSAYVDARAAQATYDLMGIGDRFGFYIDGGHNHCAVPAAQVPVMEAFVDRFLLGKSANTNVATYPSTPDFAGIDQGWMPWALRNDIRLLVSQGTLTTGQGNGLSAKLEAALASLAGGQTTPALNQLNAFNNQVNAFVNSHALTADQGAALQAKVEATRALVGSGGS